MQPRAIDETSSPVRPRVRFSTLRLLRAVDHDDRFERFLTREQAKRLVAMFRIVPFAGVLSIEHPADTAIPGDDTRRYGDTAVTFLYAP